MFIDPRQNIEEEGFGGGPPNPSGGPMGPLPYIPKYPSGNNPLDFPFIDPSEIPLTDPSIPFDPNDPISTPFDYDPDTAPTRSKPGSPAPNRPRKIPPQIPFPGEIDPDMIPRGGKEIPLMGREFRWYAYYNEWLYHMRRQGEAIDSLLDAIRAQREVYPLLCDNPTCLFLDSEIARLEKLAEETGQFLVRVRKLVRKWFRLWFNLLDDSAKIGFLKPMFRNFPDIKKVLKRLRRIVSVDPEGAGGPLMAQFGDSNTLSGRQIVAFLEQQAEDRMMTGGDEVFADGYTFDDFIDSLMELFNSGTQYTYEEVLEILGMGDMPTGRAMGQTTRGTYSKGGQFGATPTPTIPTEPPPEEPARPEGEMARAFAKFNRGRMGRGIR